MTNIAIKHDTPFTLKVELCDSEDLEIMELLLKELTPFFENYVEAVTMVDGFDKPQQLNRARAVLAMKLLTDSVVQNATALAEGMKSVANGSERAADYGFPEFNDGVSEDVIE